MKCDNCYKTTYVYTCSGCKTGYYCSQECQKEDWKTHRKFCRLWGKKGIFYNPGHTRGITKYPARHEIKPILDAKYLNLSRNYNGDGALHNAVIKGDIDEINRLLSDECKVFINCIDHRLATPLYYACTHDAIPSEAVRNQIVSLLMDKGANPILQSGFSGMAPHEAALQYGYRMASRIITEHKYYKYWKLIKSNYNQSTPPKNIDVALKKYHDLKWRSGSLHWLFSPTRENMMNLDPHPKILQNLDKDNLDQSIDDLFEDCYYRHIKLIESFQV